MIVQIGQQTYTPQLGRPIMVILSPNDIRQLQQIINQAEEGQEIRYADFITDDPEFNSDESRSSWLVSGE